MPRCERRAAYALGDGRSELGGEVISGEVATHDRTTERPRVCAVGQRESILRPLLLCNRIAPGESYDLEIVPPRRLVSAPVSGQPRVQLGVRRLPRRHGLSRPCPQLVRQHGPHRRILPIEPLPQRLTIEHLFPLPPVERRLQLGLRRRPPHLIAELSFQVRLQPRADDDHPRIADDVPVGEKQQRADEEEMNDRLAEQPGAARHGSPSGVRHETRPRWGEKGIQTSRKRQAPTVGPAPGRQNVLLCDSMPPEKATPYQQLIDASRGHLFTPRPAGGPAWERDPARPRRFEPRSHPRGLRRVAGGCAWPPS
ncbi:uncharacterized protein SOCEGT47_044880 [Sorangium cellulosum]|uniref:Uncharacterized protein n=1 Tax=Sorangium cellulosum TaxID=56 RepID=A0A4P2Q3P7_SORCE|nr:uncharacterized protein SOCEGT47_044880 [Sorangium cellulosum]